jgi:hypothetical protein
MVPCSQRVKISKALEHVQKQKNKKTKKQKNKKTNG